MNRASLEKQRAGRVAKAEARAGIKEGVYVLRDAAHPHVRVTVNFYPKECWIIEDVNVIGGASIPGTGRKLTDDVKARLESFL